MDDRWNEDGDRLREDQDADHATDDRNLLSELQRVHDLMAVAASHLGGRNYPAAMSTLDAINDPYNNPFVALDSALQPGTNAELAKRTRQAQNAGAIAAVHVANGDFARARFAIDNELGQ